MNLRDYRELLVLGLVKYSDCTARESFLSKDKDEVHIKWNIGQYGILIILYFITFFIAETLFIKMFYRGKKKTIYGTQT